MPLVPGFGYIVEDDCWTITAEPEVIEPAQPVPELPAEVWHTTEADGDARMRAVRALSRAA